jgi:hypothetical protein
VLKLIPIFAGTEGVIPVGEYRVVVDSNFAHLLN